MEKKLIALLLAAAMAVQPVSAVGAVEFTVGEVMSGEFASEESDGEIFDSEEIFADDEGEEKEDTFQMGDDIWVKFEGETATILGTGTMWDYLENGAALTNKKQNPFAEKNGIRNVIIGNNITSIGDYFLNGKYEVENVVFGDSIKTIGQRAFSGCNLNSLILPEGLNTIKEYAFCGAEINAKEIKLPDSITRLERGCFNAVGNMGKISLPSELEEIPDACFSSCRDLKSIEMGEKIKIIGAGAFSDCQNLLSITLPKSLCLMEGGVFRDCISLETVIFSEGCQMSIPYATFFNCRRLQNILIPEGITGIGTAVNELHNNEGAFENCSLLQEITIPKSVSSIWEKDFKNCERLVLIKGYSRSTAERFAKEHSIQFESLGSEISPILSNTIEERNSGINTKNDSENIIIQESESATEDIDEEIVLEDYSISSQSNGEIISPNDVLGVWQGTYDGTYNDSSIKRSIRLDISDCSSDGNISGYATIDSGDNGKYYFKGSVDLESGEFQFEGTEWMNNPSDFRFATFAGTLNITEKTMSGTLDSDSNRTFSMSKTSPNYISYVVNFQNMAKDFSGEYDGSHNGTRVRKNIEIHIQEVSDKGVISGTAIISPSSKADSSYGANGSYYFSGTLQKNTGKIEIQGNEWIDYPVQFDNFNFIAFSGYLDVNEGVIIGTTEEGIWAMEVMNFSDADSTSGFTLGVDNNNFVHTSSSTWKGAGFVGVTDYTIADNYFNRLTANSSKSEKNKIKKQMKQKWEGSCYGIAMSMGLLYEKYIGISDLTDEKSVANYHSMSYPCNNDKLLNMINYYQLSQNLENGGKKTSSVSAAYNNGWFTGLVNWACSYDSLSVCLKKLVNYSSSNHVELLGFSTSSGGHAVLVTGCEYDNDTEQYKVQIYDENSVDSATSKGVFSYMNIAKDFSSFSYTDSNGDIINDKTYVAIYFLDWNALGNIVSTAKKTSSDHVKLDFLLGDDFKAVNADGNYIQYNDSGFTGDMNIYDISTVDSDDGVRIIIETDDTDYVTLSKLDSNVDIECYTDEEYLAIQGKDLDAAKLTFGEGIELQGDSYSFTAYVGMDKLNKNEDGLLSVSADANSDTTITKQDNELEVKSNDILSNIMTTDYAGTETEERKHNDTDNFNVTPGDIIEKASSSISLKDKTVTFSGKGVSIGKAVVIGSTGNIEYEYYSDNNCKNKISSLPINVGTYYVKASVAADDNYEAASSNVAKLTINKAKITNVSLSKTKYVYNGKVQKPSVVVKDSKGNKLSGSNYTIAYSKGCKSVGIYKVTIKLKGNYTGKITKSYNIVSKGTSISKVVAKSKGFAVTWKKQTTQTTGYQIQYSTSSKFSSAKTVSITKNTVVTKTITKLKGKKKYYVRVRTYKVVGGKKYYSSWSKAKYVITKK